MRAVAQTGRCNVLTPPSGKDVNEKSGRLPKCAAKIGAAWRPKCETERREVKRTQWELRIERCGLIKLFLSRFSALHVPPLPSRHSILRLTISVASEKSGRRRGRGRLCLFDHAETLNSEGNVTNTRKIGTRQIVHRIYGERLTRVPMPPKLTPAITQKKKKSFKKKTVA